jgi:hypothetical protein
MTARFKPGSRVQQMWEAYDKDGPKAATALGPSLNLSPSTINGWVRVWDREKQTGTRIMGVKTAQLTGKTSKTIADPVSKEPKVKLPKKQQYKFTGTGKQRIRCTYLKGRLGWLTELGYEQSVVKWDDDFGETCIINRFLRKVDAHGKDLKDSRIIDKVYEPKYEPRPVSRSDPYDGPSFDRETKL